MDWYAVDTPLFIKALILSFWYAWEVKNSIGYMKVSVFIADQTCVPKEYWFMDQGQIEDL